jgi:predicted component of type VI protein secretion system
MHITIECLSGSLAGKTLNFNQPEISLGRGEQQAKDVDFLDTDTSVSRNHGMVFVRDERIYYTDQSRGGTLARGEKIQGATIELQSGDELQLGGKQGPVLKVVFRLPTAVDRAAIPQTLFQTPTVTSPDATVMQPGSPPPPPKPMADSTILQGIEGTKNSSTSPPKATPAQNPIEKAPTPTASGETIFQDAPPKKAAPSSESGETIFQEAPPRSPEPARSDETYFQGAEVDPGSTVFQGTPSQVEDTGATVLQDSPPARTIPWIPITLGLSAVAGAVWLFFLR